MGYLLESLRLKQSRQEKNGSCGTSATRAYSPAINLESDISNFYFPFQIHYVWETECD